MSIPLIVVILLLAFAILALLILTTEHVPDRDARVFIEVNVVLIAAFTSLITADVSKTIAEHKMYKQIRDDVNITSHKLYQKWLIDNPKVNQ
jgi:hypothetical protein